MQQPISLAGPPALTPDWHYPVLEEAVYIPEPGKAPPAGQGTYTPPPAYRETPTSRE